MTTDHTLYVTIEEDAKTGMTRTLAKDRCPVCGKQFDQVAEINVCRYTPDSSIRLDRNTLLLHHPYSNYFTPEDLITEEDDYEWCV